jgi:spermidine synthase
MPLGYRTPQRCPVWIDATAGIGHGSLPLKKWTELERITTPDGSTLSLATHDSDYVIRVNGRELMSTRHSHSEEQLGVVGCQPLAERQGARVLIGGLGLGFTLRTALANLPADATVVVAELLPEVVTWNRNPAYPLAAAELSDPRTQVIVGDVARVIEQNEARFDAILLDADNETTAMNTAGNSRLYQASGLAAVHRALNEHGSAVYWSAGEDPQFAERFASSGFEVNVQRVRRHPSSKASHYLIVGRRQLVTAERSPDRGR